MINISRAFGNVALWHASRSCSELDSRRQWWGTVCGGWWAHHSAREQVSGVGVLLSMYPSTIIINHI